jgi:replicative superfamily II helicase
MGVNLPAHLVVVMGTALYEAGVGYQDMDIMYV